MAKVLEGPGMGLLRKWGLHTPNYLVVSSAEEFDRLAQANDWLGLLQRSSFQQSRQLWGRP